jgi:hypothetical protein
VTGQVYQDKLTKRCKQVDDRGPRLPPVPDSVQKDRWFTGPVPLIGQAQLDPLPRVPVKINT